MRLHPLHGLLLIEVCAFLYLVEKRRFTSVIRAGIIHVVAALAFVAGTFALQFSSAHGDDGISDVFAAAFTASILVICVIVSLLVATMLNRRRARAGARRLQ